MPEGTRGTLPPPDLTSPRPGSSWPPPPSAPPVQRLAGNRAEEAWLRARVEEARAAGEAALVRSTCTVLARWLASRERDLDEAVDLATLALSLGDDAELRREVAAWLESLGEPAAAAGVLRPLGAMPGADPTDAAYLFTKIGVLKARAGAGAGAAAALEVAVSVDADDPRPPALLGALSAWQPDAVAPSASARAYVMSARRRAEQRQYSSDYEGVWRALAADPSSELAARAVADELEANGQTASADEVWRSCARALSVTAPVRASALHAARRRTALACGATARALGAALDEGLDRQPLGPDSEKLDALLQALGGPEAGDGSTDVLAPAAQVWVRALVDGDIRAAVVAMEDVAKVCHPETRSILLSVGAERLLDAGDEAAARRLAKLALEADPSNARSIATLADTFAADGDRFAVDALERAVTVLGPHYRWCRALSDACGKLADREPADREQASVWSQRCVALRPGDVGAIENLLDRLIRAGDIVRLADTLAWLLSQPHPLAEIARPFGRALREVARSDAERSAVIARRALDVFGPKTAPVRDALLDAAAHARDDVFATTILERWLSCGADGADRRQVFANLAELYERLGDKIGEARVIARAVREGLVSPTIDSHLERLTAALEDPEAKLWQLSARAGRLAQGSDPDAAAWAWREFGGALWDLAGDRVGAVLAWERAARVASTGGHTVLALDLVAFGGGAFVFEYLRRLVDAEPDDQSAGVIAADVARAAASMGEARVGLELAGRGLLRCPASASGLEAAELCGRKAEQPDTLSALYDLVAGRAFGRFGRRAAHYRGARFFERRGNWALALKHAAQAFAALPSEGSTFHLLARAADRAGNRGHAVRVIEQVADGSDRPETRAKWLLRAATVAGGGVEGARRKVEVLLRATRALPTVEVVARLREAARDLLRLEPDEREALELRFGRAARTVSERLTGPDGARVAIAFAQAYIDVFGDTEGALSSVERAFSCDADVEEFAALSSSVPSLARAHGLRARLDAMLSAAEASANAGADALRVLESLASAAGESSLAARAAALAGARKDTESEMAPTGDESPKTESLSLLTAQASDKGTGKSVVDRAEHWTKVAEQRALRGDPHGAVRALLEACRLDPDTLARWIALERIAESAGADEARILALEQIGRRVSADDRVAICRRLAFVYEGRNDVDAAERAWQDVLSLDPDNEEADRRIESIIVSAGRFADLSEHLARRARRLSTDSARFDTVRAVRLRRAAILEQRLGRVEEACEELDHVLAESPDHSGALRYLADLLERRGDSTRAARVWSHAAAVEDDPEERDELDLRAGKAFLAGGDSRSAFDTASRVLTRNAARRGLLEFAGDAARALEGDAQVSAALEQLAGFEPDSVAIGNLLLESAIAAAGAGDLERALRVARKAAEVCPNRGTPRLLACGLAYRLHGMGDAENAARALGDLALIDEPLRDEDIALRAFLVAEARDIVEGGPTGLEELESARIVAGDRPLIALGRAERLAATGQPVAAVAAYRAALGGTLRGLRSPGRVAISAADCAIRANLTEDASRFLDFAERYDDVKAAVQARRGVLEEGPGTVRPLLAFASKSGAYDRFGGARASAGSGSGPTEASRARLALARSRLEQGHVQDAERLLRDAFAEGLTEAGDELVKLIGPLADRSGDLVRIRFQQAALEPGEPGRLEALRAAALADGDSVYASAVEHVLCAFDADAIRLAAPSLSAQPEQSGILALLTRPSCDAVGEALALLWEGAAQLFARDAASYAVTGVERVVPGGSSAIARVYEDAIRTLEAPRIPLFVPRSPSNAPPSPIGGSGGRVTAQVALMLPPSVILSGDVREDAQGLLFELGRGMSAALAQNVLRMGLPLARGRAVMDGLRAAFGAPPESGRPVDSSTAQWAESFWQVVPARTQRRMQQLLSRDSLLEYGELVARAHHSGFRVGMFLSGDFAYATRTLLAESTESLEAPSRQSLRRLCLKLPALADLFRLAVSPEYATARWHSSGPLTSRGPFSVGKFNLS